MKKELLELMEIKNIDLISIYKVNYDDPSDKNIGIKIVYDKNKVLNYDYKYRYFKEYLIRIREVYRRENNNVIVLDSNNCGLIDSLDTINFFDFDSYNLKKIFPFNRFNGHDNLIKCAIKNILESFNYNKKIEILDLKSFNQNYRVKYKVDGKDCFIVFNLILSEVDEIKFIITYIQDFAIKLDGIINLYDDCMIIRYNSQNNLFEGKINAFAKNGYKEEILKNNGNTVDIKESKIKVDANDLDSINRYLSSMNLDLVNDGILLFDNTYLFTDLKDYNNSKKRKLSYYISFIGDYIYILKSSTIGMMINTTLYPTNVDKIEYILKKINNDQYIVCEKLLNVNDNYFTDNNCKYSIVTINGIKENIDLESVKKKLKE